MTSIGLYVHIPFCKKKCGYCDFTSFPDRTGLIDAYIETIVMEAGKRAKDLEPDTVYIGGGTPSLLSSSQLSSLLSGLKGNCFGKSPPAEFTIESNPGTVSFDKLKLLHDLGIDRLSIGAQSFDDVELKLLGRIHTSKQIYEAYEAAKNAGFMNINLDLIFALPGQSLDSWKKTLNKAIDLGPEHISAYNLLIEEGTPFYDKYGIYPNNSVRAYCNTPLPDNDLEYEMYKGTIDILKSCGYDHYEISNFAKPGFECRHNINYWKSGDYIGIGLSAASHINGQRYENTKDLDGYLKDPLKSQKTANTRKEEISETIFMGLRLLEGIDLNDFKKRFGNNLEEIFKKEISVLMKNGLVLIDNGKMRLTEKGLFLGNSVFEYFV